MKSWGNEVACSTQRKPDLLKNPTEGRLQVDTGYFFHPNCHCILRGRRRRQKTQPLLSNYNQQSRVLCCGGAQIMPSCWKPEDSTAVVQGE